MQPMEHTHALKRTQAEQRRPMLAMLLLQVLSNLFCA